MNKIKTYQKLAYITVILIGVGYLLYIGKSLLIPLIFAIFLSVLLTPIDTKIKEYLPWNWLSIVTSFCIIVIPIMVVTTIISFQLIEVVDSLPSITDSLYSGLRKSYNSVRQVITILPTIDQAIEGGNLSTFLSGPTSMIKSGIVSSSNFIFSMFLTFIYSFFLLFYRKSFKNFIIYQFSKSKRSNVREVIEEIQETIQNYVGGLGLVVIMLSVVNSIGLLCLGVNYAIFWGILAGLLAIIPYIGSFIGGLLPFLYSFATADYSFQPWAVLIYYTLIQQIEGNLITPKIVGSQVDVNPLVAIFSLLFFGMFWGVPGILIGLPIVSIIKIILFQFDSTKPISILMSNVVFEDSEIFKEIAEK